MSKKSKAGQQFKQQFNRKPEQVLADINKIRGIIKNSGQRMTVSQITDKFNANLSPAEKLSEDSIRRSCKKKKSKLTYCPKDNTWGYDSPTHISDGDITAQIFIIIHPGCINTDTGKYARDINNALGNGKDKKKCDNIMRILQGMVVKGDLSRSIDRPYKYFRPILNTTPNKVSSNALNEISQKLIKISDNIIEFGQIIKNLAVELFPAPSVAI